jgi:hypothetical protein
MKFNLFNSANLAAFSLVLALSTAIGLKSQDSSFESKILSYINSGKVSGRNSLESYIADFIDSASQKIAKLPNYEVQVANLISQLPSDKQALVTSIYDFLNDNQSSIRAYLTKLKMQLSNVLDGTDLDQDLPLLKKSLNDLYSANNGKIRTLLSDTDLMNKLKSLVAVETDSNKVVSVFLNLGAVLDAFKKSGYLNQLSALL